MKSRTQNTMGTVGGLTLLFVLAALVIGGALVTPHVADAGLYFVDTCSDCHNYPPDESATRGTPDGAVVGSHAAHNSAGATCADCHVEPLVDEWNHSDGFINLITAPDNGYGTGTTWAQTNTPVLTTCTTASCHNDGTGSVASPTWGSAQADSCVTCHGQPPATGKHVKHNGGFTMTDNQIADCDSPIVGCHVKPADTSLGGAHINGTTEQSCSSTACHNTGLANASQGTVTTADWANGTLTADCTWCHGNPPTAASGFNHSGWTLPACSTCHGHDGAGLTHIERDGNIDDTTTCTTCHNQPPSGASFPNTANAHDNHFTMTVTTNAPITDCTPCHTVPGTTVTANHPNATTEQSCNTATCHNNSLVSGGSTPNPAWTDGPFDCGWCHQNGTNTIPEHTYASGGQYASNACVNCHTHNGSGADHLNGALTATNATCDSCHNRTTPPTQGEHVTHLTSFTMIPNDRITDCNSASCHSPIPTAMNHADGIKQQGCDTTQCHNRGLAGATKPNVTPADWNGALTADCSWCHGNPTAIPEHTGVPGTTGCSACHPHEGTGNPITHIDGSVTIPNATCTSCHQLPPDGVAAPNRNVDHQAHWGTTVTTIDACTDCHAALPVAMNHADGTTDMVANCYTSCHNNTVVISGAALGSTPAPVWGTDGPADCGWCHGNPPTASPLYDHVGVVAGACSSCHGHDGSGGTHINGTLNSSTDCASCHAYPPAVGDTRAPWNVEADGAHVAHIAELADRTGSSLNAATDTYDPDGVGTSTAVSDICGACHNLASGNHSASGGTGTVDMGVNTLYQFAPGTPPSYNGVIGDPSSTTPKTCSGVSCHFTETPMWSDPAAAP